MSKVRNENMKGKTVVMACGQVSFDAQGIAEIPDDFAVELVQLNGYEAVDGIPQPNPEENPEADETSTETETQQEDAGTDENGQEETQPEENPDQTENDEEKSEDDAQGKDESTLTIADLEGKNVAQLKKVAKDNDVDLAGATKKDEIMSIIIGALGLQ